MRVVMGQHLPLTPRLVLVEECIDHTAQTNTAWCPKLFSNINIWSDKLPLCVTHNTRIVRIMGALQVHSNSLADICLWQLNNGAYCHTMTVRSNLEHRVSYRFPTHQLIVKRRLS